MTDALSAFGDASPVSLDEYEFPTGIVPGANLGSLVAEPLPARVREFDASAGLRAAANVTSMFWASSGVRFSCQVYASQFGGSQTNISPQFNRVPSSSTS